MKKNNNTYKAWNQYITSKEIQTGEIPYGRMAFLMYEFIDGLYKKLISENKTYALFMSREGEFFKELFDIYQEKLIPSKRRISSHYFYISRRASLLPSIKTIQKSSFKEIYKNYNVMSINNFLKNLQLADHTNLINDLSNDFDLDRNISNFSDSSDYHKLMQNEKFINACLSRASKQRDYLQTYLKSFNEDFIKEGINLVDVGYSGTTQNNIYKMYDHKIQVNGYYMFSYSEQIKGSKLTKNGILHDSMLTKSKNIYTYNSAVIEMICLASHCGVDSFYEKNGKIIHAENYNQNEIDCYENIISPIQESILKVFKKLIYFHNTLDIQDKDYHQKYLQIYKSFIFNPSEKEMKMYMKIPFEDNFGIYRSYAPESNAASHKWFTFKGLYKLISTKFRCLKDQNVHWIAVAAYKIDMRVFNILTSLFPKFTMKSFEIVQSLESKNKDI